MPVVFPFPTSRFWLLATLLAAACTPDKTAEHSASRPAAAPAGSANQLRQINVFVDMSGGMRGFMHANDPGRNETGSEFQRTVMDLLSDVNRLAPKLTAPPAYYFFKEKEPTNPQVLVPST